MGRTSATQSDVLAQLPDVFLPGPPWPVGGGGHLFLLQSECSHKGVDLVHEKGAQTNEDAEGSRSRRFARNKKARIPSKLLHSIETRWADAGTTFLCGCTSLIFVLGKIRLALNCGTSRSGLTRHVGQCMLDSTQRRGWGQHLHSPQGVMFSKVCSPNQVMGAAASHPQCLCTASCFCLGGKSISLLIKALLLRRLTRSLCAGSLNHSSR